MVINALNYKTVYSWSINNKAEEVRRSAACFSTLYGETFREMQNKKTNFGNINIKVYFSRDRNQDAEDNYCLLNDIELKEYIEWIKKITKFNIRLSNKIKIADSCNDLNYKMLSIKFTKRMPYEIKLICALVRNLYECPYNIMVKTAFLLKNHEEYANLDFTERLCIAINSIAGYNTGHSTFQYEGVDFYNDKSLRNRYCKAARTEMNVNGFMLKNNRLVYDRNYFDSHDRDEDDEDITIFDSLEEDYISDEYMKILQKNYKIMKNNNG